MSTGIFNTAPAVKGSTTRKLDLFARFLAVVPLVIGALAVLVMWGWIAHIPAAVQIRPDFAPMQFNTAFCFVLCCVSLLALIFRYRFVALIASAAAVLFAAITLSQYALGANYGIDTFFVEPFLAIKTSHIGRMAPNTAVAFILIGASLFLCASMQALSIRRAALVGILASVALAAGAVPLLGYASGVQAAYGWDQFTAMAIHTAGFFVLLAMAIIAHAWHNSAKGAVWLPIPLGVAFATTAISMSAAVLSEDDRQLERVIEARAQHLAEITNVKLDEVVKSLNRMAARWRVSVGVPQVQWQSDASAYIKDFRYLSAVQKLDRNFTIQWVEPFSSNENLIGRNLSNDEKRRTAIQKSIASRQPSMTDSLELLNGGMGFLYYVPLFVENQTDGALVAVFDINNFFNAILAESDFDPYFVTVAEREDEIFSNLLIGTEPDAKWVKKVNFTQGDVNWVFTVTPKPETLASHGNLTYLAVLGAGLFMSLLASFCTYFALKWRYSGQTLEEANRLNSAILASASHMIIATDRSGKVHVFNKEAERALGYETAEIVNRQTPAIWHDREEIRLRAEALSQELGEAVEPGFDVFTRKTQRGEAEVTDWTLIRKDGSRFPAQLSSTALRDGQQQIVGYLGILQDISERRENERMKNEFISIVSHELRTPLTSIRGSLGLILKSYAKDLPIKVQDLMGIAYNNCERLILILNDMLDIDKFTSGEMRFDLKRMSLAVLARQAVEANAAYAQKFNTRFDLVSIDETIGIEVDPDRFIQVLSNLLSNAAKHSPPSVEIKVFSTVTDGKVRVYVKDKGPGIPEESRSSIFKRFSQIDPSVSRTKDGTGMGLYISKQIVERMGGTIDFLSQPGGGTAFWVEFPVLPTITAAPIPPTQNKIILDVVPEKLEPPSGLPRLLLIEDDIDFGNMLKSAFSGRAEILTATTLEGALALLRQNSFSLIILDVGMPDGSGLGFLDEFGAIAAKPTPVVIVSAHEMKPNVRWKVAASLVKSRVSEAKIVETVFGVLEPHSGRRSVG